MIKKGTTLSFIILVGYLALVHAKTPLSCVRINSREAHSFKVENAITPAQIRKGLMFVTSLPADQGMLFHFNPPSAQYSFWMKNTKIPLDMLFIDENNKIIQVAKNRAPDSVNMVKPKSKTRYVLEINGGLSDKYQIKVGDKIQFCDTNTTSH